MTGIRGKVAVVTGGGSGIGMGLARELAREGASVVVADIMLDNARMVADAIVHDGGKAIALPCDVCERDSIAELRDKAVEAFGPVQLVFANAGATSFDPLVEMSDADAEWIVQVNLMGVLHTTRAFLPGMIDAGGGHICATSSMAGLLPGWLPNHAVYAAAKAGIIGLMLSLGIELKPHGIHTTAYCPGGVATGMKLNNARYRPERFGGPGDGSVHLDEHNQQVLDFAFYRPEAVAPMVLKAVRDNRPFVFDHAEQRRLFRETYSGVVEACYDDIAAWEREHGRPEPNPTGAALID